LRIPFRLLTVWRIAPHERRRPCLGKPIHSNKIIAGADPVAVDTAGEVLSIEKYKEGEAAATKVAAPSLSQPVRIGKRAVGCPPRSSCNTQSTIEYM
jgi:hypothetical protein